MSRNVYISLLIMILAVYFIRVLPFILIRGEIKNRFIRSFLYYVPCVTLSVMTFPAMITATSSPWSGLIGFGVGLIVALIRGDLFTVAVSSCAAVFISELFLL